MGSGLALGIDVGGTSVKAAVLAEGRVAGAGRSNRYQQPEAAGISDAIAQGVSQALHEAGATSATDVQAIGVCVPGVVDPSSLTLRVSANLPALVGVSLLELLRGTLPVRAGRGLNPIFLSDAHAAAIDVAHALALPIGKRLLAISIGTGVGACVLDGGPTAGEGTRLVVAEGSSGHLGHIDVRQPEPDRPIPITRDGSIGILEAYIGLNALECRYGVTGEAAVQRLAPGQAPFAALVQALRIAHAMYRPDVMALLGGVGLRLHPRLDDLRREVATGLTFLARPGWSLLCGTSDHHAAAGAARRALTETTRERGTGAT